MTLPAPTFTAAPAGSQALSAGTPTRTVTLTDTGSYSPAATARRWEINGQTASTAIATALPVTFEMAGTYSCKLFVTNTDGTVGSSATVITVTDSGVYAGLYDTPATDFINNAIPDLLLPLVYIDPLISTPGLPTTASVAYATTNGTIGPGRGGGYTVP